MMHLSNRSARGLILQLQGLSQTPRQRLDNQSLVQLIRDLGYVQVDSIRWIERAQHMILFSRSQHYRPIHLRELLEKDRTLFENYTHDASLIPSEYFCYWRHRFARSKDRLRKSMIKWQGGGFEDHCASLKKRIRRDGPIRSRDLKNSGGKKTGEMWQWHDGKAALEFLWRTGVLSITSRDGFQKVYDLSERVIWQRNFSQRCTRAEFIDWSCRQAITRLGIATPSELADFWQHVSKEEAKTWLRKQEGKAVQVVSIDHIDDEESSQRYARADIESLIDSLDAPPPRVRVLSPFDPAIRNRKRLEQLFGFEYRIEIYVPEAKRKYGYYVFPLLEGDRMIGRIDMKANRDAGELQIKRLWLEPSYKLTSPRLKRIDAELNRVAKFADMDRVKWLPRSRPPKTR